MDRIINIYNKIRKNNKLLTAVVSALGVCLLAVVVVFVSMPDIKAAVTENTVTWTPEGGVYKISSLPNGDASTVQVATINVPDTATTVTIDGSGVSKNNVSIVINYTGAKSTGTESNPALVRVVLKNVNISQTADYSAIRFTTVETPVDYAVTVDGSNLITSSCEGAKTPLISVESRMFEIYRLKKYSGTTPTVNDYIEEFSSSKYVGLVLCGESADDTLRLSNGANSYGALIGSGETGTTAPLTGREKDKYLDSLYDPNNDPTEVNVYDADIIAALANYGFYPSSGGLFDTLYAIKADTGASAGKIIIGGDSRTLSKPLTLILNNAGYGAAIGGGGNAGTSEANKKGANAGRITINSGTITYSSTGSKAPVFGSGYLAGANNIAATYGSNGGIEINGGSLFFNNYDNVFGTTQPVNKQGKQVYEIKASNDKLADIDGYTTDGEVLAFTYTYDTSLSFDANLTSNTVSSVGVVGSVKMVNVTINLPQVYNYEGRGHGSKYLYFYVPAVQTTTLTIQDEFGLGGAEFEVKDKDNNIVSPVSDDKTSSDSRKYVLVRGMEYYINPTKLPTGLTIKNVTLDPGGVATNDAIRGYKVVANVGSIVANVTYSGKIDIVYDDGLLGGDRDNHDISMPSNDYEYGIDSLKLDNLGVIYKDCPVGGQVEDIIFDKWVYTDADGNELGYITHIVKNQSLDGYQKKYSEIVQADGKIYLKAKWKIKTEFVIGTDATYSGSLPNAEVEYAYGTGNILSVSLPNGTPVKDSFAFAGWTLDDGDEMFNYSTVLGAINSVDVSTLTSHRFYANYERTDFCVYIDASTLDERYASLTCLDQRGVDMLVKNGDGSLATVVKDGKTYYYTTGVIRNTNVRVVIKTKHGYKMENTSIKVIGSASSDIATDGATGQCTADILVEAADVFVTTNATFKPVEYEILFKDGKQPNEVLWGGTKFSFNIEDIAANKTIGDIIREGLGDNSMSDDAIAAYINTIDKNDRFTDFYGFTLPLYADALPMDKTIASIYTENPSLVYGDMVFTAEWREYDKYAINVNLFERIFEEGGLHSDVKAEDVVAVLYYYADGATKAPVYTEEIIDPVTGDEKVVAFAKAGDKIEIELYRANSKGKPIGDPITSGILFEELYYEYESKLNESVRADIRDGSTFFTVKDDVKDDTTIEVYMTFSLKKYNIVYWDLRGFDNSMNPTTYTILDEIEFVPITDGVDWLLVCPDTDDTNNDDVTTEVIYKINQFGKLVTDGDAGNRDYMSNLILKPDWGQYAEDSYTITIDIDDDAYGSVKIMYPQNSNEFNANDMVILSVIPNKGYKLVDNSLVYKKETPATFTALRTTFFNRRELNEVMIPAIDAENGTYLITMPSSNIVVSAMFELCQYNIIYSDMAPGVVNENPDSYNVNSSIELAEPVREGYTFLGWYDSEGNKVTKIEGRTGDLVLTPRFELNSDANPEDPDKNPDGDAGNQNGSDSDNSNGNEGSNGSNGSNGNNGSNGSNNVGGSNGSNGSSGNGYTNNNVTVTGRPSNVVSRPADGTSSTIAKPGSNSLNGVTTGGGYGVQTGDTTDVPKLALICAAAVLILLIFALKRPNNKDEEE